MVDGRKRCQEAILDARHHPSPPTLLNLLTPNTLPLPSPLPPQSEQAHISAMSSTSSNSTLAVAGALAGKAPRHQTLSCSAPRTMHDVRVHTSTPPTVFCKLPPSSPPHRTHNSPVHPLRSPPPPPPSLLLTSCGASLHRFPFGPSPFSHFPSLHLHRFKPCLGIAGLGLWFRSRKAAAREPVEVGYWHIRGLGAPLRMMCSYAGDTTYNAKTYEEEKRSEE